MKTEQEIRLMLDVVEDDIINTQKLMEGANKIDSMSRKEKTHYYNELKQMYISLRNKKELLMSILN